MPNTNCWEFMKCGRELPNAMGVCPAATEVKAEGINGGKNAGRVCWAVAGTFCGGIVQGTYAQKFMTCISCDFRMKVQDEMGYRFKAVYL